MVPGRCGNNTGLSRFVTEVHHLVVGTPAFKRENGLEILALQKRLITDSVRQERCGMQRRLPRDVIDLRVEYSFDVGLRHGE